MSDPSPKSCPACGAELPASAPEALCPKCLIQNAGWSQTLEFPGETIPELASPVPTRSPSIAHQPPVIGADFGAYRILRPLGRGGMGTVFEAEEHESGRVIALKVLSHKLDSDDARKRFIREGRLAASINHPNSVYVFGTEEIEGTPVIAMEVVPGGTLQEKVMRDGPLSADTATDTILQIIAGLEAAQSIGILHRDVKPSNCFIDGSGAAKIGDFGLSISTEARGDSHLTMQGALMGTPAFSSPEQLRGDELNSRSDMYSVGATLFFLLTGRAPFEEANMIKLLSRVLEEQAPDPRSLRQEIPKGLARTIVRCLSKTPADRFKSYDDLRNALLPYNSDSPSPATLALRFGAYMMDSFIIGSVGFFLQALAWGNFNDPLNPENIGTPKHCLISLALNLIVALYFGLFEGIGGSTPGKKVLRLRVVIRDGGLAGAPRAFLRALILISLASFPFWIIVFVKPGWMTGAEGPAHQLALGLLNLGVIAAMFSTARRQNGYAGFHELATNTRVLRGAEKGHRPSRKLFSSEALPGNAVDGAERIGPYHVIEELSTPSSERWLLAYDSKLLRRVWIHAMAPGSPPVPPSQRNLNRPGRLRWLTGRRSDTDNWDAYEAPSGKPLSCLMADRPDWDVLRFLLLDLAVELETATKNHTLPEVLSNDRIWVSDEGHAKLLDFAAPGSVPAPETFTDPGEFLHSVGQDALASTSPPAPLHARKMIEDKSLGLESLRLRLSQCLHRQFRISRLRRLGITLAVSAFPFCGLFFALLFIGLNQDTQKNNPELTELSALTTAIRFSRGSSDTEALRQYIAHQHRELIKDGAIWSEWKTNLLIDPQRKQIAIKAVADYPTLSPEQIETARKAAEPIIKQNIGAIPDLPPFAPLMIFLVTWIFYSALPSLLMALIMRRGLVLLVFGAVVVTRDGQRASRMRTLWRGLIAWSPFLAGSALAALLFPFIGATATTVTVVATILSLTSVSLLQRDRSLQDRLAGTWLVPN